MTGVTGAIVAVLAGNNWGTDVTVQGFQRGPDIDTNSRFNMVGPDYFKTLGIPLLAGREFTRAGRRCKSPKVAIVNEAFVGKFKLGADAVGKLMTDEGDKPDTQIIGVARDAKYSEVKARRAGALLRALQAGGARAVDDLLRQDRGRPGNSWSARSRG